MKNFGKTESQKVAKDKADKKAEKMAEGEADNKVKYDWTQHVKKEPKQEPVQPTGPGWKFWAYVNLVNDWGEE